MRVLLRVFINIFLVVLPMSIAMADANTSKELIGKISINENTKPEIKALYEQLSDMVNRYDNLTETYLNDLQDNADAMKEIEQSTENKLLGAAATGTTGIGGMMTASALAEQNADTASEQDMRAYLETFRCTFGTGQAKGGEKGIILPGGNALLPLYTEYKDLAEKLTVRKQALGLQPGIESEVVLDKSAIGLYDDEYTGITNGTFASLSRAIQNPIGDDAKELSLQKDTTAKNLETGAITLASGVALSAIGNFVINKDAQKENSAEIRHQFESQETELLDNINQTEQELDETIEENKAAVEDFNNQLKKHKDLVAEIKESKCADEFVEYIQKIDAMNFITDDLQSVPDLEFDDIQMYLEYQQCLDRYEMLQGIEEEFAKDLNEQVEDTKKIEIEGGNVGLVGLMKIPCNKDIVKAPLSKNTRYYVGDECSGGGIKKGVVVQDSANKSCSCSASSCIDGFDLINGECIKQVKEVQQETPNKVQAQQTVQTASQKTNLPKCPYAEYDWQKTAEECVTFCKERATKDNCEFFGGILRAKDSKCVCSPTAPNTNVQLEYFEVCGGDKGKTGGEEVCVKDVFNWVNVGQLQALGLAEEYARIRHNDDVICDTDYRTSWNDDYIKCTSKTSKSYYEFKFDDIKESIDADIQEGLVFGICGIYGIPSELTKELNGYSGLLGCKTPCSERMKDTARKFGLTATTKDNACRFTNRSMSADEAESKLAKIDGIDNYIFYSGIQVQGSQNIISQLKDYIISTGKTVKTFDCIRNVNEIKNSILVGDDDVLPCTLNGEPIDFVFDDFSESWLYVQEDGEAKIQCVVSGGKYADQTCFGLTEQQCVNANKVFKKKFPSAAGMSWNGKECTLLDSAEAQSYDIYVQAGIGIVAAADCLVLTHTGCLILAVETAGLATELTTQEYVENRAGEFLAVSTRCYERNCAVNTIREAGKVLSVMGALDAATANSVDSELARLVDYLEPSDLPNVPYDDWGQIVAELGGDPDDTSGTALVWLNRIGLGAQFASIATSGYRLLSKAITRLASKATRTGNAVSDLVKVTNATNTGNATSDLVKVTNAAGDAGKAADTAKDVKNAVRPLHPNIDDYKNAQRPAVVRAKYHPDKYQKSSPEIYSKAEEIYKKIENIDNMSDAELSELSRLMYEFDDAVAAENAAKAANAASDADKAADAASDAGRGTGAGENANVSGNTSGADKVADSASDAGQGAGTASSTPKADEAEPASDVIDGRRVVPRGTKASTGSASATNSANDAKNLSQQQVLKQAVEKNNKAYGTKSDYYKNGKLKDRLEMYKSSDLARLEKNYASLSEPITDIRGHKVYLEDIPGANGKIGQIKGRPIVVVNINGKKIPFYLSTGEGNKIKVPTGKWEAIFGIRPETDEAGKVIGGGWFRKGQVEEILAHYDSPELKQIADALDDIIGDVRDSKLVESSAARARHGGSGDVAISTLLPDVNNSAALDLINESLPYGVSGDGEAMEKYIHINNIRNFLRNL